MAHEDIADLGGVTFGGHEYANDVQAGPVSSRIRPPLAPSPHSTSTPAWCRASFAAPPVPSRHTRIREPTGSSSANVDAPPMDCGQQWSSQPWPGQESTHFGSRCRTPRGGCQGRRTLSRGSIVSPGGSSSRKPESSSFGLSSFSEETSGEGGDEWRTPGCSGGSCLSCLRQPGLGPSGREDSRGRFDPRVTTRGRRIEERDVCRA
jgi:hypothetical protein